MAVLDGALLYATPNDSWDALLLVMNCGGGDAARRLAGDRDSLSTIRNFIKFAPDWKALELALKTARYPSVPVPFLVWASRGGHHLAAVVVEYARFLGLFKGVPHGFLSPPPSWPKLWDDPSDPDALYSDPDATPTFELVNLVWKFHSTRDSYAEDCLVLTGREIPYYEYEDSPTCVMGPGWHIEGKDAGLMGYRRLYKRYAQVYGTPPSYVWPDVTALVILANKCQSHINEWTLDEIDRRNEDTGAPEILDVEGDDARASVQHNLAVIWDRVQYYLY